MKIELLYFSGCPHYEPTRELIDNAVSELGIEPEIEEIDVQDEADATRHRFLGSPSIRVDGLDIEASTASRSSYALSCRMYRGSGIPPRELLIAALGRGDV